MRIAIVTFHRAFNCGALLQAWALSKVLTSFGHIVSFPHCNWVGDVQKLLILQVPESKRGWAYVRSLIGRLILDFINIANPNQNISKFLEFRRRYIHEVECKPEVFNSFFDMVVIGSDQVWSPKHISEPKHLRLFLGEEISKFMPIISYAASCGDELLPVSFKKRLFDTLKRYVAVSVREEETASLLRKEGNVTATVTCDPTFMLSRSDYNELIVETGITEKYIYYYCLYYNEDEFRYVQEIAKFMRLRLVASFGCDTRQVRAYQCYGKMGPCEMVSLIRNAECVISSSFHGTAISIIYGKPFVVLHDSSVNGNTRILNLVKRINSCARVCTTKDSITKICDLLTAPIESRCISQIVAFALQSKDWLRNAVSKCSMK